MNSNSIKVMDRNKNYLRMLLVAFLVLLLTCFEAAAQDIITLKGGKEIKVIITGENTDVVKYREFSDQAGPEYSVKREQIESIKYRKGERETGVVKKIEPDKNQQHITNPQEAGQTTTPGLLTVKKRYVYLDGAVQSTRNVKNILQDNAEALALYSKGQKQCSLSNQCAYGVILTSLIVALQNGKTDDSEVIVRNSAIGLVIDGAFVTAAVVLVSSGKKRIRSAAEIYNESIRNNQVSFKLDFGIQQNGIGLALKF